MSNERIDLTQFEEIEARIKQCQKGFYPAEDLLQELAHHAPSLLAELKRCYEELDEAQLKKGNEQWEKHWKFIRDWLTNIADGNISGNDVVKVMDARLPRGDGQ